MKTNVSDTKTPISRLVKAEKAEFTGVNEYFSDKRNEEIGVFVQTLIKTSSFLPCLTIFIVGAIFCKQGSSFNTVGTSFSKEESLFSRKGTAFSKEGSSFCIKGTSFSKEIIRLYKEGSTVCIKGAKFSKEGTSLSDEGAKYSEQGS